MKSLAALCLFLAAFPALALAEEEPPPKDSRGEPLEGHYLTSFEKAEFGADWDGKSMPNGWSLQGGTVSLNDGSAYRGELGFYLSATSEKRGATQLQLASSSEQVNKAPGLVSSRLMLSAMMRVSASPTAEGHEFLDFDGALLALVADPANPSLAELQLFHSVDGEVGWWFATGAKFPLCREHGLTAWLDITVTRDFTKGVYSVEVDGHPIMQSVGAYPYREEKSQYVWFFGGAKSFHLLDDVYLGPPAEAPVRAKLREKLAPTLAEGDPDTPTEPARFPPNAKQFKKKSGQTARRAPRGKPSVGEAAPAGERPDPISGVDFEMFTADETLDHISAKFDGKGAVTAKKTPKNKLPVTFRITLRTQIEEGLRLDHVSWHITRHFHRKPDTGEIKEVFASGDFSQNLVQEVEMPYDLYEECGLTMGVTQHD
jgi:hypothetical protein